MVHEGPIKYLGPAWTDLDRCAPSC